MTQSASNQIPLFETPPPPAPVRLPDQRDVEFARIMSDESAAYLMAVFEGRPGVWLDHWGQDLRAVIDEHNLGSGFGFALHRLAYSGRLIEKRVYHGRGIGAEQPGSPNYEGFHCAYMLAPASECIPDDLEQKLVRLIGEVDVDEWPRDATFLADMLAQLRNSTPSMTGRQVEIIEEIYNKHFR